MKILDRLKTQLTEPEFLTLCGLFDREVKVDDHSLRLLFLKALALEALRNAAPTFAPAIIPPRILQFWDQATPPADVLDCINRWRSIPGYEHHLFDQRMAEAYIHSNYGARENEAFAYCHHPAMRCDYFRLAFLAQYGGIYIDADNVPGERPISELVTCCTGLLLQPLCSGHNEMISRNRILADGGLNGSWRYYFNNDPIITKVANPIIFRALRRATEEILLCKARGEKASIHWVTGPDNISDALFEEFKVCGGSDSVLDFCGIGQWEAYGYQIWKLNYRDTERDWRLGMTV